VVLRAHHDLRTVTRRTLAARQLTVTHLGGLVTSQRDQVTSPRNLIAIVCCLGAPMGAVEALLGAAVANCAGRVMHLRVAAVQKVAIAGCLIAIGRRLLSTRGGLLALGCLLVGVR
jgi:hypothetical protein